MDAMTAEKSPAPPPPGRRLRRLAKLLAIGVFVLGAIVLSTPLVLSMDWARRIVERRAGEVLGVPVRIEGYSFNWLSGFRIHGVRIGNPTGFRQDRPLLAFDEARGDLSLLSLLTDGIDATASLDGLKIHLEELADGRSNLGVLLGTVPWREDEEREEGRIPASRREGIEGLDLSALRLQVRMVDASIEIVRSGTVIESLRIATARISKEFGNSDLRLETAIDLLDPGSGQPSGRIEAALDVDTSLQRPLTARFTSQNLELGRYSSLIASLADPGAVTALEGTVNGTVLARVSSPEDFEFSGTLTVDGLRLSGDWFAGMDIVSDRWLLGPNLVVSLGEGRPAVVEAEGFFVDTGFCTVRGVAGGGPGGNLALEYTVDLEAMAPFGGPIPAEFAGSGAEVRGKVEVSLQAGMADALETLIAAVRHDGEVQLDRLVWRGVEFDSVDAKINLSGGVLRLTTGPTARINGGPLFLSARAALGDLSSVPLLVSFRLQESALQGDLLRVLAYAIPLLGGLGDTTGARFAGKLGVTGTLRGPLLPADGEHWLEWLDHWTGSGDIELRSASLALAPSLASFLEATGNRGSLAVNSYKTSYSIRDGAVATNLAKLSTKGKQIGFSGSTTLDGKIDYRLDVSGLLAGHRDGEKVLRAIGGKMPHGRLAGTLESPTIALPDIADLFNKAGTDILQGKVLEELNRSLNRLFGGKKK